MKMTRLLSTLVCGIVLLCGATPVENARPIRVACIGDSITARRGSSKGPESENYPEVMARFLEEALPGAFEVANFGIGGTTGWVCSNPWWNETRFDMLARVRAFQPDILIVMFGVNDCAQWQREGYVNAFAYPWDRGMVEGFLMPKLIDTLPNKPRVIWGTPSWVWGKTAGYRWSTDWPGAESRMASYMVGKDLAFSLSARKMLESALGTPVPCVDVYALTHKKEAWYSAKAGSDGIHPNREGFTAIARAFADAVLETVKSCKISPSDLPTLKELRTKPQAVEVKANLTAIQRAIDAALPGDTIRVAPGKCVLGATPIRIYGKKNLTLEGRGTQLAHDTSTTGRVVEVYSSEGITIRGFSVSGGRVASRKEVPVWPDAKGTWNQTGGGGGFLVIGNRNTVADCTFDDCQASDNLHWAETGGGALAVIGGGNLIENCRVTDCASFARTPTWSRCGGGGIFVRGPESRGVTNVVRNCTVTRCRHETMSSGLAFGSGGGIWTGTSYGKPAAVLRVENCTVTGNTVSCTHPKMRPYVGDAADVGGYRLVLENVKTTSVGPESVLSLPDPPPNKK